MTRKLGAVAIVALLVLGSLGVAGRAFAAVTVVTGTLTSVEPVVLSPAAVAVVTLVDQTATPEAGAILGEQRIEGVAALPAAFEVPYDDARIDPTHSYAIVAAIVDGDTEWDTESPVPVITGGPLVNVDVPVVPVPPDTTVITGSIEAPADATLSEDAVATAVLIKQETGTLVSMDTLVETAGDASIDFSLGYEPDLIDPAAHYVVRAAIVDGDHVWGTAEPGAAITDGVPVAEPLSLTVVERDEGAPGPSAEPSEEPSLEPTPSEPPASLEPSAPPTAVPTPRPLRPRPSSRPARPRRQS